MKRNQYFEAFKENYNLVGLSLVVATAAAATSALPLLVGVVAETAYLVFWADSRWYNLRMAKKYDAEIETRRAEFKAKILPTLHPTMRARFDRLEQVRRGITDEDRDDQDWFRQLLRKLDLLLERWLQFASKDLQFREYLESVRDEMRADAASGSDPAAGTYSLKMVPPAPAAGTAAAAKTSTQQRAMQLQRAKSAGRGNSSVTTEEWVKKTVLEIQNGYDAEISNIASQRQGESDTDTCAVLDRRQEILKRRREFVSKIGRVHVNLEHQMGLLEDTFGLVSDEVRARSPEQVLSDVDDVVSQSNTMTQLLDEVAPYQDLLAS